MRGRCERLDGRGRVAKWGLSREEDGLRMSLLEKRRTYLSTNLTMEEKVAEEKKGGVI